MGGLRLSLFQGNKMKQTELTKIINEEIKNVLNEYQNLEDIKLNLYNSSI